MNIHYCYRPDCGRPFQVNEYSASTINGNELAHIACPHCGAATHVANSHSIFLSHALSNEEESSLRETSDD
jgi:hypothetical protein